MLKEILTTKKIVNAGIIASVYAVMTMCLPALSYGQMQIRFSEALTILPLFYGEAVLGLFVGCMISNILGNGIIDIIFGSLATLIAGIITYYIGRVIKNKYLKLILGQIPPIVINTFIIPLTYLGFTNSIELYFINVISILIGQSISIFIVGTALYFILYKIKNKK